MELSTKYNVGEKLFWVEERGGTYTINFSKITGINIEGKHNYEYGLGLNSRPEKELFTDFNEAKTFCIQKQKEINDERLKIVNDYSENSINGGSLFNY